MTSIEHIAGQVMTIGLEGVSLDSSNREMLDAVRPGGVIYFQRNIETSEEFAKLVFETRIQLRETFPFLAIDLEGGTVDRLRQLIAPLPAVQPIARRGLGRELGILAGRELSAYGLNVDFAPVLDLSLGPSENVLTTRTAGQSPEEVIRFALQFLAGLSDTGIVGCGKHFPGLGGGNLDSHLDMPCIGRTYEELWSEDLLPYRELADSLPMVMVAHAWYPHLERELGWDGGERPASISPEIISLLLRSRLNYSGLVLCDDLEMGGVLAGRCIEEAAIGAIAAGCDVLLVCRHATNVQRVHQALVRESAKSFAFRTKLDTAARRVQQTKEARGIGKLDPELIVPDLADLRRDIQQLAQRAEIHP